MESTSRSDDDSRRQTNHLEIESNEDYPDRGTRAWLVVLGAWCAMIPSMGLLNSLAVLHAWLGEHELKGMSESTVGWIFSGYAFFLFFCGAQIGKFPKYSVKKS
ncbi:unnamed protein product [Fusarium venenatum]|uniref:Major facilitator superfamily (MFS) profile domain-containing protein n=1 Tax=Fusarium venenatum TaxID=56646 RepID=A0A2L2T9J9_9HYPO|nr:uncharacterized protein FVRRES_04114 [Fusarium venenatum]CEI67602.1 unnamed protein product [Fusarium venenatum]